VQNFSFPRQVIAFSARANQAELPDHPQHGFDVAVGKSLLSGAGHDNSTFSPNWRSTGTCDDQRDVILLSGPAKFLHPCLNNGQEFIRRQAPIFFDELGGPHFAMLLTLWIWCLSHSV
jgi:hypothetical protein